MRTRIKNFRKGTLLVFLPLIVGVLPACSDNRLEADVTRFHLGSLLDTVGRRVTIRPARPELESLEFDRHAVRVGEELARHGFTPAGDGAFDIVALLDYSVSPIEVERESPMRIGIGGGGFGSHVGGGAGLSFPVGGGSSTVWARRIDLVLTDEATGARLWEGRAVSEGKVQDLDFVLPLLTKALLRDFPGISGQTLQIEIDPEAPLDADDQKKPPAANPS